MGDWFPSYAPIAGIFGGLGLLVIGLAILAIWRRRRNTPTADVEGIPVTGIPPAHSSASQYEATLARKTSKHSDT
ncbi:unnamed protein product [Rhizoctonia solani]|uniref:Uncharacterized protein n=1 Tax=Rhizoctonia solani TaxID=456999 RepID=A0A8H3DQ84_9AGAM|nr:unnamed protein product [Rhizoctonia solani]